MVARSSTEYVVAPTVAWSIAQFLEFRRLRNLSVRTITRYTTDFRLWTAWRERMGYSSFLPDITIEELRAYFAYLRDEHIPHSTNPHRQTYAQPGLRPYTIQCHWKLIHAAWVFWTDEELLTDRQMAFFARGRIPGPKVPLEIRPTYDPVIVEALLAADGPKPRSVSVARDHAVILLLYDTGMRVSELCDLTDEAMNYAERRAKVRGKGEKHRYVFWTERTAAALEAYRTIRPGTVGGALFRGLGTGGRARKRAGMSIGPGVIRDILERRAARAAVTLPPSAVHALRHSFAHRFLDNGGDGLHLQQLLGHESIVTTMRYVRENPTALQQTYRRIFGE